MTAALRTLVEGVFAAFEAKDLPTALGYFADDAVMIDPHYPTPTMRGQRDQRRFTMGLWRIRPPKLHDRSFFGCRRWPNCRG